MQNLKTIRKNQNFTQQTIAKAIGIPITTYATYEQNKAFPNENILIKLADFFCCSVDYLLGHETPNILHLDGLTASQKRLIDLAQKLDDNQANYIAGRISELLGLSYEQARPTRPF